MTSCLFACKGLRVLVNKNEVKVLMNDGGYITIHNISRVHEKNNVVMFNFHAVEKNSSRELNQHVSFGELKSLAEGRTLYGFTVQENDTESWDKLNNALAV